MSGQHWCQKHLQIHQGSFQATTTIDSDLANEEDDNAPELSHDFSCAIVTRVNSETGETTTKEADEEEEVENELVAAVVANAQSGKTLFSYFEVAKL